MKIRTQGKVHRVLMELAEWYDDWCERKNLTNMAYNARALSECLVYGWVERAMGPGSRKAGYRITKLGFEVLKRLDEVQPGIIDASWSDEKGDVYDEYWKRSLNALRHPSRKVGYKMVEVPVRVNKVWKDHFDRKGW